VNFFWQGGSSRPETAVEGRETSEVKKETYASCIVLNFSYYEAPTFYIVKRMAKIVPYRDRPWILEVTKTPRQNPLRRRMEFYRGH
jgi:hypothetical protein